MRLLYIGYPVDKITSGADAVNKRNIDLLKQTFNSDFYIYNLISPGNVLLKIKGYFPGLSQKDIDCILLKIYEDGISIVFISQSLFGRVAKAIKEKFPSVKVIVFYHNIERHYAREFVKISGWKHYPFYLMATYNENLAIKYADFNLTLNNRDSKLMQKIYGITSDLSLPVSYNDLFDEKKKHNENNDKLLYLFVGTAFFANIHGIKLFVQNVLPEITGNLIIVGKGMQQYKDEFMYEDRVQVFDYVESLSELYYQSTVVIAPIFSGGGMKTKIAEALMYGKKVIGSTEALEGYEIDNRALVECYDMNDFKCRLVELEETKNLSAFCPEARDLFLKNHDNKCLQILLDNFVDEVLK